MLNQSGCYGTPSLRKESKLETVDIHEGLTKGEVLIEKLHMVFMLMKADRDDTAAAILQQVFDELAKIK